METRKKWTIVGAASVIGLGAVGFGAVNAANAMSLTSSNDTGLPGIAVGDDRSPSGIPSAVTAPRTVDSTPSVHTVHTVQSAVSAVTPASPVSAVTPPSPATPPSPPSPATPPSPASPASAGSAGSAD